MCARLVNRVFCMYSANTAGVGCRAHTATRRPLTPWRPVFTTCHWEQLAGQECVHPPADDAGARETCTHARKRLPEHPATGQRDPASGRREVLLYPEKKTKSNAPPSPPPRRPPSLRRRLKEVPPIWPGNVISTCIMSNLLNVLTNRWWHERRKNPSSCSS